MGGYPSGQRGEAVNLLGVRPTWVQILPRPFLKIVIASNNEGKINEIKEFLKDIKEIELVSLKELNLKLEIDEFGKTLEENALIKARTVHYITKLPVISDDSGLFIEALNGFPGIKSSDFQKENKNYLEKILKMMENEKNRKAYFKCVIVFIDSQSNEYIFYGEVLGEITYEVLGNNGFGYDPIFLYKPLGKTFAQIDIDIKNQISHRAKALRKLKEFLIASYIRN